MDTKTVKDTLRPVLDPRFDSCRLEFIKEYTSGTSYKVEALFLSGREGNLDLRQTVYASDIGETLSMFYSNVGESTHPRKVTVYLSYSEVDAFRAAIMLTKGDNLHMEVYPDNSVQSINEKGVILQAVIFRVRMTPKPSRGLIKYLTLEVDKAITSESFGKLVETHD